jgi:hypothetical protein
VGVSRFTHYPGENYFLRRYPYPEQVTAVGITDLTGLQQVYPGVTFVHADGRSLPFEADAFDVVHSNAVIEHVGGRADQRRFVSELVRVAPAGFVTTPNRWFPFEVHTRVPLLHWLPEPAFARLVVGLGIRRAWNTYLLSRRQLVALFPPAVEPQIHRERLFGWTATLAAVFSRSPLDLEGVKRSTWRRAARPFPSSSPSSDRGAARSP